LERKGIEGRLGIIEDGPAVSAKRNQIIPSAEVAGQIKIKIGMKEKHSFTRREALKLGAGTGLSLSLGPFNSSARTAFSKDNRIIVEHKKAGATDWQLTRVRPDEDLFRTPFIEGYCSRQSVR